MTNIGSAGPAAPAAAAAAPAAGGAEAKEEKKEEGMITPARDPHGYSLANCPQKRRSPTRIWVSACSTKRVVSVPLFVSFFLFLISYLLSPSTLYLILRRRIYKKGKFSTDRDIYWDWVLCLHDGLRVDRYIGSDAAMIPYMC